MSNKELLLVILTVYFTEPQILLFLRITWKDMKTAELCTLSILSLLTDPAALYWGQGICILRNTLEYLTWAIQSFLCCAGPLPILDSLVSCSHLC